MGWEEMLLEDMSRFVSRRVNKPVIATAFDYEDESDDDDTGPNPAGVTITYKLEGGMVKKHWYYGSLSELLDELRS